MGEGASPAGDDDALLRRELRRGAIPVEVRLAADEVADDVMIDRWRFT